MSDSEFTNKPASMVSNARHAKALADRLKGKVTNFAVRDSQGEFIGEVKDLLVDPKSSEGTFNLVVAQSRASERSRLFLVNSRQLNKVDVPRRTFLTRLSSDEVTRLPEYQPVSIHSSQLSAELASTTANRHAGSENAAKDYSIQGAASHYVDWDEPLSPDENPFNSLDLLPIEPLAEPDQHVIRTLEERPVIHRSKRKAGEVVIRKEVETRMVEVPVHYEKLVVEQLGEEPRQLAEIGLSHGEVQGVELADTPEPSAQLTVRGEFANIETANYVLDLIAKTVHHRCQNVKAELQLVSWSTQTTYHEFPTPKLAKQVLEAIAQSLGQNCKQVTLELDVENVQIQQTYQQWFDWYRKNL